MTHLQVAFLACAMACFMATTVMAVAGESSTTPAPSVNRNTTFTGTAVGRINATDSSHTVTSGNLVEYLSTPIGFTIDPRVRQFYYAGHFSISGVTVGGLATTVIHYPCSYNVNSVVKISTDGLSLRIIGYDKDTGTGARFLAPSPLERGVCAVELTIRDGGDGDDDLAADGVVKDPFFLAYSVDSGTGASMIAQALIPTIIFAGVGIGVLIGWLFARSRMSGAYSPVSGDSQ